MNERIRELMAEADRKCSETRGIYDEILARLIVEECVELCETAAYAPRPALNPTPVEQYAFIIGEGNMAVNLAKQIRKHFGVEE